MSLEQTGMNELRVVILGANQSGKTSVITSLRGQAEFEFLKGAACEKGDSEVDGIKFIFIDTSGWWRNNLLTETAGFIKQDLLLSVYKCPPGPHAFILVIGSDAPFTEKNRRSVEEHLGLFGENIWEHTIVVFAKGEYLKGTTIEQHIESEGEALKWLVGKCGNRCHMFNIDSTEGCNEVGKILKQIDILAKSKNSNFELDEKILREVEEKRNTYRERAQQRRQKVQDQREILHRYGVIPSLPELRIYLLGWLFSGKTSASKTIIGQGDDVQRSRTYRSLRTSGEFAGRRVSVVDTPGWWKYLPAKCTPEWVKKELQRGLILDSKAPHAILLAVPVDTAFSTEQKKITEDNMRVFGDNVWRHTMVLFTCGDLLGETSIEEHIECEGEHLEWLVEKCGNRYHVISWNDKEDEVIELLKKIEEMVTRNSLFCLEVTEAQRSVGKDMTEELQEEKRKLVDFLDLEWRRKDTAVQKKIDKICSQTRPTTNLKGSKNAYIDWHEDQEHPCEINAVQLERLTEMLEKEWSRREIGITERFQNMLSDLKQSD
ncbi:GTPase IMAP family member 8-like [Alosa pseudoharengus]|uniref:GTPase IMAP family member 8-like n=1 Tax=Alosa pseudoharengus TaxID=34774 RepID=UPI003F89DB1A